MTPIDPLFPKPQRDRSWWARTGPSGRGRRHFDVVLALLVAVFAAGWTWGIANAAATGTSLTEGLMPAPLSSGAPEGTFLLAALVDEVGSEPGLRGRSGAVRVAVAPPGARSLPDSILPDTLAGDVDLELQAPGSAGTTGGPSTTPRAGAGGGVWELALRTDGQTAEIPGFHVLTPVPMSFKEAGRIGSYRIGDWPFEEGVARAGYETPEGLVEVTPENVDLPVSEHFVLGDFLTKGQADVWPKYVAISTQLLDKLELTLQELEEMGHPVEQVGVISGFRTPFYNAGGGNPSGRGSLSRHMYGDAMDFFIDNDGDFCMDDLTGDGRATVEDARVLARAAERVERAHPELIGGIGTYSPTGAHCGFVHVDTRGTVARW